MPGAQPARSLATRLGASSVRRSYVGQGVPGVWRVQNRRTVRRREAETFDNPWIQGPDFEVTYNVGVIDSWSYAVVTDYDMDDADIAQLLKDGDTLSDDPDLGGGPVSPRMGLLFNADVLGEPGSPMRLTLVQSKAAQVSGAALGDLGNAISGGFYEHHGFEVIGRSELDDAGRPYPLLHLRLRA